MSATTTLATGCDDVDHRDIQDEINILTRRNDALVPPAMVRLAGFGRMAIPQIEVAMHTSAPRGRLHLVEVIGRLGDAEAVPVLRHFSLYDTDADVRESCETLLAGWAKAGSDDAHASPDVRRRGGRALAALAEIARKRAAGEAPLVFQDGTPGAPTVGAPDPVGIELEAKSPLR